MDGANGVGREGGPWLRQSRLGRPGRFARAALVALLVAMMGLAGGAGLSGRADLSRDSDNVVPSRLDNAGPRTAAIAPTADFRDGRPPLLAGGTDGHIAFVPPGGISVPWFDGFRGPFRRTSDVRRAFTGQLSRRVPTGPPAA